MSSGKLDFGEVGQFFLETGRFAFRCWTLHDLPLAQVLWGDSQVTRYLGGPFSFDQVRERLEKEIANRSTHGIQYWPFFVLPEIEFVGCAGLRPRNPEKRIYELGCHLRTAYWGKGLAREAAQAVIRYAFDSLKAEELFAGHHPENVASSRVLAKLGFVYTHDEVFPPTGLMHPGYALRKPETVS